MNTNIKLTHTDYLTLFKLLGFYQIVDPNSSTIFNINIFKLICVLLTIVTTFMTMIGLFGVIYTINIGFEDIQMFYLVICILVGIIKIVLVMSNANKIFNLFEIAQTSFLSNKYSKQVNVKNVKYFNRTFPWYFFLVISSLVLCIITPVFLNFLSDKTEVILTDARKPNFFNFKYPFTNKTYNLFYKEFYLIETLIITYSMYCMIVTDLFLLATLQLLSDYYESVTYAFKNLNFESVREIGLKSANEVNEDLYNDFISVILDCQNIFKGLQKLYKVAQPIILLQVTGDASTMITMPYLTVLSFHEHGSIFNLSTPTFVLTLCSSLVQCYMYCNLCQLVNDSKESVNFGLYSCNWIQMDLRMKKLILHTMRLNNSNNLKIKVTPMKLIELSMFAAVVRSSYSITSVLINSNINM